MQKRRYEHIEYDGFLKIEKAQIEHIDKLGKSHLYSRERLIYEDAVAVFIVNKDSGNVVLAKQFRYAISDKINEPLLEIIAGKVSPGEDPKETVLREAKEECGYQIESEKLDFITYIFASPGYSTERIFLYYAEVSNEDKVSDGGGLEEENEFIEVIEMPLPEFMKRIDKGEIHDSKTLVSAMWVMIHKIQAI
ncbi:MAG: NUDIX hydrolase [Bacteroidetes bacterium]|nr:NUDIX hydrolase [Bacteroidota bacterium]HET6243923.1 NUDIX hydrolase [Bacteroidia bacterium]